MTIVATHHPSPTTPHIPPTNLSSRANKKKMSRCNKVEFVSALAFPIVFYGCSSVFSSAFPLFPFISQFLFHISRGLCWCVCVYIIFLQREPITIERAAGDADAIECHWLRVSSSLHIPRAPDDLIHLSAPGYLTDTNGADGSFSLYIYFFIFLFAHPISLYCGYDSEPDGGWPHPSTTKHP